MVNLKSKALPGALIGAFIVLASKERKKSLPTELLTTIIHQLNQTTSLHFVCDLL
jgi:hypothetical protein